MPEQLLTMLQYIRVGRSIYLQIPDVFDPWDWTTLYFIKLCETELEARFITNELNDSLSRIPQ